MRTASCWLLPTARLVGRAGLAVEVRFDGVAAGFFAHIGDKGPRTAQNEGLNARRGLAFTSAGAVLIDSGASLQSARPIHEERKRVMAQPLRWIVDTGEQGHRWLGNGCFAAQRVDIIAHARARADTTNRGNGQLRRLRFTLGAKANGAVPTPPTRWLVCNTNHTHVELDRTSSLERKAPWTSRYSAPAVPTASARSS